MSHFLKNPWVSAYSVNWLVKALMLAFLAMPLAALAPSAIAQDKEVPDAEETLSSVVIPSLDASDEEFGLRLVHFLKQYLSAHYPSR